MARQTYKQKHKREDGTEGYGEHYQEEITVTKPRLALLAYGQG